MIRLLLPLLCTFMVFSVLKAQHARQNVELANKLSDKYKDDDVLALSSKTVYNFKLDKSSTQKNTVQVFEERTDKLIALKDYVKFSNYIFYDDISEIKNVSITDTYSRKKKIPILDKEYNNMGIFHSDGRMKIYGYEFSAKGEIIYTSYRKKCDDIVFFPTTYFYNNYSVDEYTLEINIPEWLNIELKEVNFERYNIEKSVTDQSRSKKVTYTIKGFNKLKSEKNAIGPSYYLPHILILPKSYESNQEKHNILNTLDDLYQWYASLVKQNKSNIEVLKPVVNELIKGETSDLDKIKSIYYWIQDNIRYIAFEDGLAGFMPEKADVVYKNKFGDCKGMANLAKEMLKIAGLDARLCWLGTRRIAYDYNTVSLATDNHMICAVIIGDKKLFIDPTEEYANINEIAERIQGRAVLIENGDSYFLENIPVLENKENHEQTSFTLSFIDDGKLAGIGQINYVGEAKTSFLRKYNSLRSDRTDDALNYYLSRGDKNLKVSNIQPSDLNDRDAKLKIDFKLELNNFSSKFGNDIYLSFDVYKEFGAFLLDSDRVSAYALPYKVLLKNETVINVPAGYKVSYLPKNMNIINEEFVFDLQFEKKNNKIIYHKRIEILKAMISPSKIPEWNKAISKLADIYSDQIVFSK